MVPPSSSGDARAWLRAALRDASPGTPAAHRDAQLGAISFPQRLGGSPPSPGTRLIHRLPGPDVHGRQELHLTPLELLERLARHAGATVFVLTSGAENCRRLEELGAHVAIDRTAGDVGERVQEATGREGVDVVLDSVGETLWGVLVRALAPAGRLVTYGATTGPKAVTDLRHVFWKPLSILGRTMGESRGVPLRHAAGLSVGRVSRDPVYRSAERSGRGPFPPRGGMGSAEGWWWFRPEPVGGDRGPFRSPLEVYHRRLPGDLRPDGGHGVGSGEEDPHFSEGPCP